jgi:hypothetical protein
VNTISAYKFTTSESSSLNTQVITTAGPTYTMDIGIKVYTVTSSGVSTCISRATMVASAYDAYGTSSKYVTLQGTWSCPSTPLDTTDSIKIEVWGDTSITDMLKLNFTTEQLGATNLDASNWTVHYYIHRIYFGKPIYTCEWDFLWGISGSDSYITNFGWTGVGGKTWHSIIWAETLNVRNWSGIIWTEVFNARAWHTIFWNELFNVRSWHSISWFEQLFTPRWHSIVWIEKLTVHNNAWDLAAWVVAALIFFPMLIIGMTFIRRKR